MLVPLDAVSVKPDFRKRLAIFGSTGSIGKSALEIVRKHPRNFDVEVLVANSQHKLLIEQAKHFKPKFIGVRDEQAYEIVKANVKDCTVVTGIEVDELAVLPTVDTIIAGIVGSAGLAGVLKAIAAGKEIALANKESIVAGGKLVSKALEKNPKAKIIPVDSEHSAVYQCLHGNNSAEVTKIILTASGGPFRLTPKVDFPYITPEQACKHPNWSMGQKISVDSATMMNKALEIIEAYWLFSKPIDVLIHPQSIVHSLVEYQDGSQLAQLSVPDMQGAIAYAMSYPYGRLSDVMNPLVLSKLGKLEFYEVDTDRFRFIRHAKEIVQKNPSLALVMNAANEFAVKMFLSKKIRFDQIFSMVETALTWYDTLDYSSYDDLLAVEVEVSERLSESML